MKIYFESLNWLIANYLNPSDLDNILLINGAQDATLKILNIDTIFESDFVKYSELKKSGFSVTTDLFITKRFNNIILFADKHKELNLYFLSLATSLANSRVIVISPNSLGGKSLAKKALDLMPKSSKFSKNHCTIFVGNIEENNPSDLMEKYREFVEPKEIENGYFTTAGIFSHKEIDMGSRVLIENIPHLAGIGADLGAGWGYLSAEITRKFADIKEVDLYEVNYLAYKISQKNSINKARFFWQSATDIDLKNHYDFVVTNPPFHSGAKQDFDLGIRFLQSAFKVLKTDGVLYLVANIHLPYEKELNRLFKRVDLIASKSGFKVIKAVK